MPATQKTDLQDKYISQLDETIQTLCKLKNVPKGSTIHATFRVVDESEYESHLEDIALDAACGRYLNSCSVKL